MAGESRDGELERKLASSRLWGAGLRRVGVRAVGEARLRDGCAPTDPGIVSLFAVLVHC